MVAVLLQAGEMLAMMMGTIAGEHRGMVENVSAVEVEAWTEATLPLRTMGMIAVIMMIELVDIMGGCDHDGIIFL